MTGKLEVLTWKAYEEPPERAKELLQLMDSPHACLRTVEQAKQKTLFLDGVKVGSITEVGGGTTDLTKVFVCTVNSKMLKADLYDKK